MVAILLYSFLLFSSFQENEYERAVELYRKGYFEESLELVNGYLERNFVKDAFFFKHKVQVQLNDFYGAAETLTVLLQYYPDYSEARMSRALVYRSLDLPGLVIKDLKYLLDNPPLETNAVFFQIDPTGAKQVQVTTTASMSSQWKRIIAEQYMKLGDYSKALDYINDAISSDSIPENIVTRAIIYEEVGNSVKAAEELSIVLQMDSTNILAWYNLAILDPGITIPENVLKDQDFAPMAGLKAVEAMSAEDTKQAEKLFLIALKKEPGNALTHLNLGRLYSQEEKYKKARSHFKKAYKLDEDRIESLYLIGNTYFKEKEYDAALAYYEKYFSIDPTNPDVWYNAAVSYRLAGSNSDACRCLNMAVTYGKYVKKSSPIWSSCK